jgi:hypothetical protein
MAKPLNRLAVMTDYLIKREEHDRTKRRHYSETLGENYGVLATAYSSLTAGRPTQKPSKPNSKT